MAPIVPDSESPTQQDPNYDIFENSSPHRPLNIYGGALVNESVDALVNQDGGTNFSRKREFPPSSPMRSPTRSPYDHNDEHSSKRYRSSNWPLPVPNGDGSPHKNTSTSRRHASTPGRPSKFQEASMHDRPSNQPPSLFTRHFDQHFKTERLMDNYYDTTKSLPNRQDTKSLPRRLDSRSPQRATKTTLHPNVSTWSTTTAGTNAPNQGDDVTTKPSGLFRFGKSMASVFNPRNIWQKVSTTWNETKEEMVQEVLDERAKEFNVRQAKAEQAYAELKQAGKLGSQGTTAIPRNRKIFSPGYTSQDGAPSQRDSGISMDDESRSSVDTSKDSFLHAPAIDSPQKGSWHTRTPSFQNLKKIASMGNLHNSIHKRSASGHMSISPDKDTSNAFASLRRSSSKVELKKHHKLSKRVSDLEAKLTAARRELDSALGVPSVYEDCLTTPLGESTSRNVTPVHHLPQVPHEDSHSGNTWQRRYTPALPALLSERLLTDGLQQQEEEEEEEELSPDRHPGSDVDTLTAIEAQADESPVRGVTDIRFYMQPNQQLQPTFSFSSPIKSEGADSEAMDLVEGRPVTPQEPTSFLADRSSPQTESPKKTFENNISPRMKVIKRKPVDGTYRPRRGESAHSDEDWEEGRPKTLRKKRPSEATNSPKTKKTRTTRVPAAVSPTSKKPNVLTKPPPPPKVPAHVIENISQPRGSLETVHEHEEIATTTTVPVKDDPSRPTARATPAHPNRNRLASRSRSRSPRKTFGAETPKYVNRDRRSLSPPPSSTIGKFNVEKDHDNDVVTAKPDGKDIPPIPMIGGENGKLERKESFEWPEDVF